MGRKVTVLSRALLAVGTALIVGLMQTAAAQTFETHRDHPRNPAYARVSYPVAFVAVKKIESANNVGGKTGAYHHGLDVLSANNPTGGNHLFVALPNGTVVKIFPLPAHGAISGLIDTPNGALDRGSVVEPNTSLDGRSIYFAYFHDTVDTTPQSYGLNKVSKKGADLYRLDLGPLIDNPRTDPATLPITRLTTRTYDGDGYQSSADRFRRAINRGIGSATGVNNWGTVYMHPVEVDTPSGRKLVYVSDEARVQNSNQSMSIGYANHTFFPMIATIEHDGRLGARQRLTSFTTTSALSPNKMRDGIAFSLQASTEDARHWQIQSLDSSGRWGPLLGYGHNPQSHHLGTFCVKTAGDSPGDYFIGTQYYNLNNEGFGNLWALNLATAGLNSYSTQTAWGRVPRQLGATMISTGVSSGDSPSELIGGRWVGKISSPRCGRPDELFFAYSPTSANGRDFDSDNSKSIYAARIAVRTSLEPFDPLAPPDPVAKTGLLTLVNDASADYSLAWPTPLIPWSERTGGTPDISQPRKTAPLTEIPNGVPYAIVGTSALYNTDITPPDCRLGMSAPTPFSPNSEVLGKEMENDLIVNNVDGLTIVQDRTDPCKTLLPDRVLGVAISLTSNKIAMAHTYNPGYEAAPTAQREVSKLLGVYDVRGQADQSFRAKIPADVPFEMHLIDRRYGMRLLDVRSWHSLQSAEERTDCGGCHAHGLNQAIPFTGTHAASSPAADFTAQTPHLDYDPRCAPITVNSSAPTKSNPEWRADIYPRFDATCGGCHNITRAADPTALAIFGYSSEEEAYTVMRERNFAVSVLGALGSPVFWAARGERTDGRDNDLSIYQPNPAQGQWGYRFSAVHTTAVNLCDGSDPESARWVYRLGTWIDNGMVRDTGSSPHGATFDYYHPTGAIGLASDTCADSPLRIGFWDDSGSVSAVKVQVGSGALSTYTGLSNGSLEIAVTPPEELTPITVTIVDPAHNEHHLETTLLALRADCLTRAGSPPRAGPRVPTPAPPATATPRPTATPEARPTAEPTATPTSDADNSEPVVCVIPRGFDPTLTLRRASRELALVERLMQRLRRAVTATGWTENRRRSAARLRTLRAQLRRATEYLECRQSTARSE